MLHTAILFNKLIGNTNIVCGPWFIFLSKDWQLLKENRQYIASYGVLCNTSLLPVIILVRSVPVYNFGEDNTRKYKYNNVRYDVITYKVANNDDGCIVKHFLAHLMLDMCCPFRLLIHSGCIEL